MATGDTHDIFSRARLSRQTHPPRSFLGGGGDFGRGGAGGADKRSSRQRGRRSMFANEKNPPVWLYPHVYACM